MTDRLEGLGVFLTQDERHEGARYRIVAPIAGAPMPYATGVLSLPRSSKPAMAAAFTRGEAQLELSDGAVVDIVPTSMGATSDPPSFEFAVSGQLPG